MTDEHETVTLYAVYTNSDLTEGRGYQYPIKVCDNIVTARRLAKKVGPCGINGDVQEVPALRIGRVLYVHQKGIVIERPDRTDLALLEELKRKEDEAKIRKERKAKLLDIINKVKELGLDAEGLANLRCILEGTE